MEQLTKTVQGACVKSTLANYSSEQHSAKTRTEGREKSDFQNGRL